MRTLRKMICDNVYPVLEFYTAYCMEHGKDAEYLGVRLLDDSVKFVKGTYVASCVNLFLYYRETGDPRAEDAWERMLFGLKCLDGDELHTWGKSKILSAMVRLQTNGLLCSIPAELLKMVEEKTRYDDFYDWVARTVQKGLPTNYFHVALVVASLREQLGWDSPGESEEIYRHFTQLIQGFESGGWMDEVPPYGRFDAYSIGMSCEMIELLTGIGKPVPAFLMENFRQAVRLALDCANPKGDGIIYGRSLSVYGCCKYLSLLSTGLRHGLIDEAEVSTAVSYCAALLDDCYTFWFDSARKSYNIWLDGRTTNSYRSIDRLMELNLSVSGNMLTMLQNFEQAGVADVPIGALPENPHDFSNPAKTVFCDLPEKKRMLYSFVHRGRLWQLPLICTGFRPLRADYLPFPTTTFRLEAPPEQFIPLIVPFFKDGTQDPLLPAGFYHEITDEAIDGGCCIRAKGFMCRATEENRTAVESDIPFEAVYRFTNERITIRFTADTEQKLLCRSLYGAVSNPFVVRFNGTIPQARDVSSDCSFFTPHGAIQSVREYCAQTNTLEIEIEL